MSFPLFILDSSRGALQRRSQWRCTHCRTNVLLVNRLLAANPGTSGEARTFLHTHDRSLPTAPVVTPTPQPSQSIRASAVHGEYGVSVTGVEPYPMAAGNPVAVAGYIVSSVVGKAG